jgi:hypothetical protein
VLPPAGERINPKVAIAPPVAGAQVRTARAALRWSIADLATNADVGGSAVQWIKADTR